jgi:hypothetical protein
MSVILRIFRYIISLREILELIDTIRIVLPSYQVQFLYLDDDFPSLIRHYGHRVRSPALWALILFLLFHIARGGHQLF